MRNKHKFSNRIIMCALILILGLLISIVPVYAEITPAKQWWDETKYNFVDNFPVYGAFYNKPTASHMMLFYPVEDWEMEVCSRELTSSTNSIKKSASNNNLFSIKFSSTTIALAASKYKYVSSQDILYNLEWYVQAIDTEVIYSVYLLDTDNKKFYIPSYSNISVAPMGSSTKVFPQMYNTNYTYLVVEYHNADSDNIQIIKTEIVNDQKASYG